MKPQMEVVEIKMGQQLLAGSRVTKTSNNAGFNETISGGSGDARASSFDGWDDDWDE